MKSEAFVMERRGQNRDIRIPNSTYNSLSIVQEGTERRGNEAVSARGAAIFSPTQTLDHRQLPSPLRPVIFPPQPPQPQPMQRSRTPDIDTDSDPAPAVATAGGDESDSKTAPPLVSSSSATAVSGIRYKECLKNHAATMGGHVVDGCGEFMPGGEEGTAEEMRCAACDCHRNFHRIEVTGEPQRPRGGHYYPHDSVIGNHRMPFVRSQNPASAPRHPHHHEHSPFAANIGGNGGGRGMAAESSSEDLNHAGTFTGSKKRFRTKFSQEQKDRMQEFADKLGWRMQKQDDHEVRQFCEQTGVKRQVFKVWMHNNKQLKKRQT